MRIAITFLWLIITFKFGDWSNWKKYYPTWLFWLVGSLLYQTIFHDWHLWLYVDPILKSDTIVALFTAFTEYVFVTIIFIPHFPKKLVFQILYISLWAGVFTFIEGILLINGYFAYYHGWNLVWSAVFDLFMFMFLIIYYKNHKALAWGLSLVLLLVVAFIFHMPLPQ